MVAAVKAVEDEHGAIGALVNNAGYGQEGAVEAVPIDEVRRQFETNVFGLLRLTQLALPAMRAARSGTVVNVSSMGGRMTFPGGGVYHASKYAVEALSDALRFELRGFGVHVVLIEPGLIKTEFGSTVISGLPGGETGSPYESFTKAVEDQVTNAYAGWMGSMAATGPESVAKAIERAVTAKHPKARYIITPAARMALGAKRFLPDRAFDLMLRTQFPTPK
jgi:short-subunit dehydrogenase